MMNILIKDRHKMWSVNFLKRIGTLKHYVILDYAA